MPSRPQLAAIAHHRRKLVLGSPRPVVGESTLTSSAASFVAGGSGVTLTFTARDADGNPIEGYTPSVESGGV